MQHHFIQKSLFLISVCFSLLVLLSCSEQKVTDKPQDQTSDKTLSLAKWFEANGNYINSDEVPSIVDAQLVYALRDENIMVIDLRPTEEFNDGHIEHAINIQPSQVLDFFKNDVEPSSFKGIFFVCNDMSISGYVTGIMRLLGYDNVYAIRYGMSGWSREVAEKFWLENISNLLLGKLETKGYPRNEPGELPVIDAERDSEYDIALEQAEKMLQNTESINITIAELLENPEAYYIICYWPEDKYFNNGHLPGAVQYDPRKSFGLNMYLNTLPVDKPVVVYCYAAQHSIFVVAYLRMLGYDAKSLNYGANAFIHEVIAKTEPRPTRTFTENLIQDFPIVRSGFVEPEKPVLIKKEEIKIVGGC
ncbi:MAG TPA: rhodanese-like domain-containing protein [Bacteroidales bacterium]|nr:rhodanese-like domain-containing protein [Bacteroidales bacterium]HQH14054.1 rhodanese-like domain-containing protein [Bacteroidales bacterium]